MKKLKISLSVLVMLLVSGGVAWAVVQSLNSQTGNTQTFGNDSNITINSANDVHSLGWNGHLPISRGGTGSGSFTTGSILFALGSSISQDNSNLFWDDTNNRLGVGTSTPTETLEVNGVVKTTQVKTNTITAVGTNQSISLNPTGTGKVLVGGESLVVAKLSSQPASASMGQIYFDTASKKFKGYNGTGWISFAPVTTASVSYLVVGGGGGGGGNSGGGGGGGGYQYNSAFTVTAQAYSVTVGNGGVRGNYDDSTNGENSVFSTITAIGGGRGRAFGGNNAGGNGGSGGGGGGSTTTTNAGGTGSQGSNGGSNGGVIVSPVPAGGGGGSSAAGGNASGSNAGGGGGSATNGTVGAGGSGGGGAGNDSGGSTTGVNGTSNTGGGGGGGGGGSSNPTAGGNGGSGIVIIAYPTGTLTATGGTIDTSNRPGYTVHTFTSIGTFTVTSL